MSFFGGLLMPCPILEALRIHRYVNTSCCAYYLISYQPPLPFQPSTTSSAIPHRLCSAKDMFRHSIMTFSGQTRRTHPLAYRRYLTRNSPGYDHRKPILKIAIFTVTHKTVHALVSLRGRLEIISRQAVSHLNRKQITIIFTF